MDVGEITVFPVGTASVGLVILVATIASAWLFLRRIANGSLNLCPSSIEFCYLEIELQQSKSRTGLAVRTAVMLAPLQKVSC